MVFKAYQLDPSAPVGQPTPVVEGYAKKFGGRERAEQILNHVTSVAAADDIEFNMDIALRANTILAHRALHWALEHHGAVTQAIFKERLMKAYFTDGLDVGNADVIAQCANEINLDGKTIRAWLDTNEGFDAVQEDLQGAAMREITAVPSFVIDDRFLIPGAQDVDVFVNVLERALTR